MCIRPLFANPVTYNQKLLKHKNSRIVDSGFNMLFVLHCKLQYYYLCTVDDVSGQTSCVISPNIATLTIADRLERDVELHCQCTDDNGMMITGTTWFHNGTSVTIQNAESSNITTPYQINTTPTTLYINAPFTTDHSHTGTYTCSPNSMSSTPPGDTITLNAGSKYIAT